MLKDNNFKNLILKINFLQSFEGGQTFFDYASPSYSIIEFFIKKTMLCLFFLKKVVSCLKVFALKKTFIRFKKLSNKKDYFRAENRKVSFAKFKFSI